MSGSPTGSATVLATFARICVSDLDAGIAAMAASGVTGVRLRFGHAAGLQLALVGDVLLLAGTAEQLDPFRATDVTVVVDDLDAAAAEAQRAGAVTTREPADQATGRNVTVAFPAGPVVEFVEWDAATRTAAGL